ncbi:MAG: hypothetical protein KC776_25240 [Myxococcales bacterium]|nr:hypothetical protein [Myxococcales bacterium]MCB9581815.1 hypothetical protein [Polyangiaceae bacterium]
MSRSRLFALAALLSLTACSRLLDFSEVTGGKADAGGTNACGSGETQCSDECVDLTSNANHCGACDTDCGGGACTASKCQPFLLAPLDGCHSVVVDETGSNVYVTRYLPEASKAEGGVYKVDLQTGEVTGVALGQSGAAWLRRAGKTLFWTTEAAPEAVWKLDVDMPGATPAQVYPNAGDSTPRRPFGLAVDGSFVYFTDKNGAIGRVPVAGDTSELLYPNLSGVPTTLDVLGSWIYYSEHNPDPGTDAIRRVPLSPSTPPDSPEAVATKLEGAWGVIARELPNDDSGLELRVFASVANGALIATPKPAGGFSTTAVSNETGVAAPSGAEIILLDDELYWATRGGVGGSIQSYRLGSIGSASEFASTNTPVGVTSVGDFLYWCSLDFGLVRARL